MTKLHQPHGPGERGKDGGKYGLLKDLGGGKGEDFGREDVERVLCVWDTRARDEWIRRHNSANAGYTMHTPKPHKM